MRKFFIVTSLLLVVLLLLLPMGFQAVWDGRFELTVIVNTDRSIDKSSLLFATSWDEREAVDAIQTPANYDYGFRSPRSTETNELQIDVPCSGHESICGLVSTYNYPKYLVVEYKTEANPEKALRKRFLIPAGRGPRSMSIEITSSPLH